MNPIEIIFRGKDETGAATASVKANLEGVEGAAKKTSTAFDTAMGFLAAQQVQQFADALSGFYTDAIAEATEAEDIFAQLDQVLKSTGGAAGLSAEEIGNMATELSRLTLYEDEAIVAGQTILLQFGKIGEDVFPQATRAMLDLATRMKIDIPSAAKIVGKALEGEYSGLARFGIVLDDATKKQVEGLLKVGDTAAAQEIILAELEKRFGGSAEAAADTFGGSMTKVTKAWKDFQQAIGESMTQNESFQKLLTNVADALNSLADAFKNLPEGAQTAIVGIGGLFVILAKLATSILPIVLVLKSFGIGAGTAGAAAAGGAAKVGLLAGAFAWLKGVIVGIGAILAGISLPVWALIAAIVALIATIAIFGKQAWNTLMMIAKLFTATYQAIIRGTVQFISSLVQIFTSGYTRARQAGANLVEGIKAGVSAAWESFKAWFGQLWDGLIDDAKAKLGISSPSKVFAEMIGKPMAQGIGVGFAQGMATVSPAIGAALQPAPALAGAGAPAMGGGNSFTFYSALTHEERMHLKREQERAAQREMMRLYR